MEVLLGFILLEFCIMLWFCSVAMFWVMVFEFAAVFVLGGCFVGGFVVFLVKIFWFRWFGYALLFYLVLLLWFGFC